MVYAKARSGDPDYDDKQPPEFHSGQVVTAGDGVYITPQGGAVDVNGAHVNLAGSTEDGDNRPAPGDVAEATSTVQDYKAEDTPATQESVKADPKVVKAIKDAQASTIAAGQAMSAGLTEMPAEDKPAAKTATPPPAKSTTAK